MPARHIPLSGRCTDQCILNGGHYWPANGCENKTVRPLHFALLSCIVWSWQSHHAVMWGNNDGSTWLRVSLGSSEWRQLLACDYELSSYMHDIRHVHVIGYSSCLERALLKLCNGQAKMFYQWVWESTLFCVGVLGRQAGLAYWWKRLLLLCGWTRTAWRHMAEGGMAPKLNYISNDTSHPSVNWCGDPPFQPRPPSFKVPHGAALSFLVLLTVTTY